MGRLLIVSNRLPVSTRLPQAAISIHVGPRPSRARFNVWDPSAFRHLLSRLAGV